MGVVEVWRGGASAVGPRLQGDSSVQCHWPLADFDQQVLKVRVGSLRGTGHISGHRSRLPLLPCCCPCCCAAHLRCSMGTLVLALGLPAA